MAGIYIHIPFCRQACHYCDFHFSTSLSGKQELMQALFLEMEARKDFFREDQDARISSVYFGGGTPSLLDESEISRLVEKVYTLFNVDADPEVTLEANPEDLDEPYLQALKRTPVNRLSIGVQSFDDADLKSMNRSHDAAIAERAISDAVSMGAFEISADLIYGSPTLDDATWCRNLEKMFAFPVDHLSCYGLTVEKGTALHTMIRKRMRPQVDDARAASQFNMLMDLTGEAGFVHYEISNFCRKEKYARHNSGYWSGKAYLGLGPSAHSYDGAVRRWNVSHNTRYIRSAVAGMPEYRQETLSAKDRYNEYVLTGLRTMWGISAQGLLEKHGPIYARHFTERSAVIVSEGLMREEGNNFYLSRKGMLVADRVTASLFA